jgi:hypothetical protein
MDWLLPLLIGVAVGACLGAFFTGLLCLGRDG